MRNFDPNLRLLQSAIPHPITSVLAQANFNLIRNKLLKEKSNNRLVYNEDK